MFTKKVRVGGGNIHVEHIKEVTDWAAVGKAILFGFGALVLVAIIF